jgi:HAD superfamily hydrolase (TIGR01549 family)
VRSSVHAILFDLDETLVDNTSTRMERYRQVFAAIAAADRRVSVDDCLRRYVELHREIPAPYGRLQRLLTEVGHWDTEVGREAYEYASDARWMRLHHGVTQLLTELRVSYPLGLVTNGFTRHQRAKLRAFDLEQFFDKTAVISEEAGFAKPDVGIFRLAAELVGVDPGLILFVGDDPDADIAGARRAGMTTAWVTGPAGRGIESDADFRIEHVTEIPAVLLALGP